MISVKLDENQRNPLWTHIKKGAPRANKFTAITRQASCWLLKLDCIVFELFNAAEAKVCVATWDERHPALP